jgi:hypothetical protein
VNTRRCLKVAAWLMTAAFALSGSTLVRASAPVPPAATPAPAAAPATPPEQGAAPAPGAKRAPARPAGVDAEWQRWTSVYLFEVPAETDLSALPTLAPLPAAANARWVRSRIAALTNAKIDDIVLRGTDFRVRATAPPAPAATGSEPGFPLRVCERNGDAVGPSRATTVLPREGATLFVPQRLDGHLLVFAFKHVPVEAPVHADMKKAQLDFEAEAAPMVTMPLPSAYAGTLGDCD